MAVKYLLIILSCGLMRIDGAPSLGRGQVSTDPTAYTAYLAAARDLLDRVPLIDGHNDFPYSLRENVKNQVGSLNITDLTNVLPWSASPSSHTDIKRLRAGKVGAQFWSAYIGCNTQYKDAVVKTLEQIDVIRRMVLQNKDHFEFVGSAEDIVLAFGRGKIGSMIGVEGGHSLGDSLGVLRVMYMAGVRYLTLTHSCTIPWADNSQLDNPGQQPVHNGLTPFGQTVIAELNRLGIFVDLAHVSRETMTDALAASKAPVMFSHSSAYALCNNTRNVPDDILKLVTKNRGIVMVNFYPEFVKCGLTATLQDVANHIDYIRQVAGVDHVGIGADYNGVSSTPTGLEDVSKYPNLFAELLARGWTEDDLTKLASGNLLRAFRDVEKVRDQMQGAKPFDEWIPDKDVPAEALPCLTGEAKSISEP